MISFIFRFVVSIDEKCKNEYYHTSIDPISYTALVEFNAMKRIYKCNQNWKKKVCACAIKISWNFSKSIFLKGPLEEYETHVYRSYAAHHNYFSPSTLLPPNTMPKHSSYLAVKSIDICTSFGWLLHVIH